MDKNKCEHCGMPIDDRNDPRKYLDTDYGRRRVCVTCFDALSDDTQDIAERTN